MAQQPRVLLNVLSLEDRTNPSSTSDYFDGRVLAILTPGLESAALAQINATGLTTSSQSLGFGVYKVTLKAGVSVPQAIGAFSGTGGVSYVGPDFRVAIEQSPNDPKYLDGTKWSLHNTGQFGATPGIDINAPEGWDVGTGTGDHVVAVIDTGIDYTHPDLAANIWTDPTDGTHGHDFVNNDNDPMDDEGHGTNVAGIIGGVGNNGVGTVGVAWTTKLMAVKVLGADGSGSESDIIAGMKYAIDHGAKILNTSLGGYTYDPAGELAVKGIHDAGAILVASAGNKTNDNDVTHHYPSDYKFDNVVSVAAVDWTGKLSFFSNYGLTSVNLGAPGGAAGQYNDPLDGIYSTAPGGGYGTESGTSQAAPHVAGALAAFWDANPDLSYKEVLQHLYDTVRHLPALQGKTVTGGMLDFGALMESGSRTYYATGADAGGGPHVKVYSGRGRLVAQFFAYDPAFTGGVRVATGDVNGDGVTDIITVAGSGAGPHVKVFDGRTFKEIASFYAFEPNFLGGLYVAAGDVNGDGRADIIVGADRGGGPRVSVFSLPVGGTGFVRVADFFAYDPGFTGGVRVAAGAFTPGSSRADVVTVPGFGGGPHVKVFRSADLLAGRSVAALETMAGDPNDRNGLFVAAGDFNNDKVADVVVGSGAGTPVVRILDGRNLSALKTLYSPSVGELPGLVNPASPTQVGSTTVPSFPSGLIPPGGAPSQLAYTSGQGKPGQASGYLYGVRVAVQDVNGDKRPDLILAGGPDTSPKVSLLDGVTYAELSNFNAYDPGFFGGVFVGGVGV